MKSKLLGLLAVVLLAGPIAAQAATLTYDISGTIDGGGTFSGFLTMTNVCIPTVAGSFTATNFATAFDLVGSFGASCASPATITGLQMYAGALQSTNYFNFIFAPDAGLGSTFTVSGSQFLGTVRSSITGAGTLRAVPEPGTLALLGLGLAGLGLARRRKAA